jgi:site-specific DNA recombinase
VRRLIASIRLSKDRDTTNSPATQRADIEDWVAEHPDNRIDYWTEDLDVSGGIPMADRPGIGPFLAEERLGDWDGIIGYRMDRLFRNQLDFLLWVRDLGDVHAKVVIDVEDGTDTSTPAGRRTLNDRVQAADYERQRMVERRSKAAKRIRLDGRYGGGPTPFGLKRQRAEGGWILVEHKPYADEARDIARRIIAGESANSIVLDMNKRGIPTSRNAQRIIEGKEPTDALWAASALLRYLRSPALKGYVLNYPKKGEMGKPTIVYGRDGLPVRRTAILDDATWEAVQDVIKNAGDGRITGRRSNAATMLLGVAKCGECGGSLHSDQRTKPGGKRYYGCQNRHYRGCRARVIPMTQLDDFVSARILDVGDQPVIEIKRGHGNERERKLAEIGQAIIDLNEDQFMRGIIRPNFDEMLASLRAEHDRLRAMPPEPSHEEQIPTGETIGQLWGRLDAQGRRAFLQGTGLRLFVSRDESDQLHIRVETGERPKYVTIPLTSLETVS